MTLSSGKFLIGTSPKVAHSCSDIFGPIEVVPVGSWWRFRAQSSAAGCHSPLVASIHGRTNIGAFSLIFSCAYPEDVDLGTELYFTASGGRNSTNRRISIQLVRDQQLTGVNKALALNCAAAFSPLGANARDDWRQGRPVRVLRSGNDRRCTSLYVPPIGVRYDGIYKVVKYWFEDVGSSRIWRFHLRRDDATPAPWTEAGRYRAKKLGFLSPVYPEGWSMELASRKKRKLDEKYFAKSTKTRESKIQNLKVENEVVGFCLPEKILDLIKRDVANQKMWTALLDIGQLNGKEVSLLFLLFLCVLKCIIENRSLPRDSSPNFDLLSFASAAWSHPPSLRSHYPSVDTLFAPTVFVVY